MKRAITRIVIAATLAGVAMMGSGCATLNNENPLASPALDGLNEDLNNYTHVVIVDEDAHGRLLRGYFLMTVFAVYGEASIERYSHNPSGDAGALLGRILAAEAITKRALAAIENNYYPVNRAEVVFALADLSARAVRPTVTMAAGFFSNSPAAGAAAAVGIFKNAVKDIVYGQAYLEGFRRSVCKLNGLTSCPQTLDEPITLRPGVAKDTLTPAWGDLRAKLQTTCENLAQKAKIDAGQAKCGTVGKGS